MKPTEQIVAQFGISLRTLASFLDTNHSHLSRYHANTRWLPDAAIPQLSNLIQLIETLPPPTPAAPSDAMLQTMQDKAAWCRAQCIPLQKKLARMQKKYQQGSALMQLVDAYKSTFEAVPEKQQRWMDELRYQAHIKMEQNNWMEQRALQIRIAVLQEEAHLYENAR